jgi:hypothetical protein
MGSRPCAVCQHPSRAAIDMALLNGKPLTGLALTFGFTYIDGKTGATKGDHKVIARHRDKCVPDAYQAAMRENKTEAGAAIAARLRFLDEKVDDVIREAEKGTPLMIGDTPMLDEDGNVVHYKTVGQLRAILSAVGQARANAELVSRLSGAVPDPDDEDMEKVRKALESPQARRLLAELDEHLAAQEPIEPRSGD